MKTAWGTPVAIVAVFGLSVFAPQLRAQNDTNSRMDDGTKKMMKSTDITFAMKAAQGGRGRGRKRKAGRGEGR